MPKTKSTCTLCNSTCNRVSIIILRSNPGETVLTPFMGVGSEVYGAVRNGRRGIGIELKPSYYRQAVKNLESVDVKKEKSADMFAEVDAMA